MVKISVLVNEIVLKTSVGYEKIPYQRPKCLRMQSFISCSCPCLPASLPVSLPSYVIYCLTQSSFLFFFPVSFFLPFPYLSPSVSFLPLPTFPSLPHLLPFPASLLCHLLPNLPFSNSFLSLLSSLSFLCLPPPVSFLPLLASPFPCLLAFLSLPPSLFLFLPLLFISLSW